MKNNIFYILLSFILMFAVGCEEEPGFDRFDLGTEFYITAEHATSLDVNVTIDIENPLQNLTEVTVYDDADDTNLGTITISGGAGSITLTTATLGISAIDDEVDLRFDAVFNGVAFSRFASIGIDDPISLDAPDVYETADLEYFYWDVEPERATVADGGVTLRSKINSGIYTDVAGTYNASDSIDISGNDISFNVGDTVYLEVTATIGTLAETSEVSTIIMTNAYGHTMTATLDSTSFLAFDFDMMAYVGTDTAGVDTADISISTTSIVDGYTVGFDAENKAEFILSDDATYTLGDIVAIEATNFSTPVTAVADLSVGDVYIYRTEKGTVGGPYIYGIMKVTDVVAPHNAPDDATFSFEFKY